ncbi:zinc finger protein 771-like isoform X2 [Procambarus clarkii]|uniref:zinc finger protein 771-like isoform X2 n=1 Tax=Procambarus clarkii TaxID=6728 RepID=UPI0037434AFD
MMAQHSFLNPSSLDGGRLSSTRALRSRRPVLPPREPYQCSASFSLSAKDVQIEDTCQTLTTDTPFKCTKCHTDLPSEPALMRHLQFHLRKKPRWCLECDKGVKPIHRENYEADYIPKPYQCAACLQEFALKTDATEHLKIHTTDLPYQCPVCQKMLISKYALSRHKEQHVNDKQSLQTPLMHVN